MRVGQQLAAIVALIVFGTASAWSSEVTRWWTAIAATGTLDEDSVRAATLHDTGSVTVRRSRGRVKIRYNVTAVDGVTTTFDEEPLCLYAVLRDTGPDARVLVTLKQAGPFGELFTMGTLDSDAFPPTGENYWWRSTCELQDPNTPASPPIRTLHFWFLTGYWVEAELIRLGRTGNPALRMVGLGIDEP